MCSILFTTKDIKDYDDINYYLKFRGPDDTSIVKDEVNNYVIDSQKITYYKNNIWQPL